jgi:YD repeat-containing protein
MDFLKILAKTASVITLAATINACKKDNHTIPVCQMTRFTLAGSTYNLTYNAKGQISSITNATLNQTYHYNNDSTIITSFISGEFSYKAIVALNASGLAKNVRTELDTIGIEWVNDAFDYNGDEVAKRITTSSGDSRQSIINYTWLNHNMVSQTTDANTITLDYHLDIPRRSGDYLDFFQFFAGYEYIKTKNLLKSFGGSSLTYEFDPDGNISSLSINTPGNTPTVLQYQYKCN